MLSPPPTLCAACLAALSGHLFDVPIETFVAQGWAQAASVQCVALGCAAALGSGIMRPFVNYPGVNSRSEDVMPIYAYGCSSCGLKKDVMQKMNDAPLHTCPECGKETFTKQLTAAGFQLKGNGYYVTDFKGGAKKEGKPEIKSADSPTAKPDATPTTAASTVSAPVTGGSV
jgi:putative FmdB family regulatory protein